jgi:hypothetical protein
MDRTRIIGMLAAAVVCAVSLTTTDEDAAALAQGAQVPIFEYDPSFPKPLPENWAIGPIGGLAVDRQDHLFVVQRPGVLLGNERMSGADDKPPKADCCVPAPPVLEFDQNGTLVNSWGGPGAGYDWPQSEHGVFVDHKDVVWLAGNGQGQDQSREPSAESPEPRAHLSQRHIQLGSQFLLRNLLRRVRIDLVAHAVADSIPACRDPFSEEPRPDVAELFVWPHVHRARVAASGDVLLDESLRQPDPFRYDDGRIRAELILWRALRVIVIDGDHVARMSKESGRASNGAQTLERLGDLIVGTDVSHRSDAKLRHVLALDFHGGSS